MTNHDKILNKTTVDRFIDSGDDVSKPHNVEFNFSGTMQGLLKLKKSLESIGFIVDENFTTTTSLVVTKLIPIDLEQINYLEGLVKQYSERFGVKYEGWGSFESE